MQSTLWSAHQRGMTKKKRGGWKQKLAGVKPSESCAASPLLTKAISLTIFFLRYSII
jgi:hypothetical protein